MAATEVTEPRRTVAIAIDGSPQAKDAFLYYLDTLHRPDNRLVLIHVIELPDLRHARENAFTREEWGNAWDEEKEKAVKLEEVYKGMLQEHNVALGTVVIKEVGSLKPGHEICNVAEAESATMIVTGTRGMGTIRRTVMGSVSDYVLHHAHCPVFVFRK